MFCKNNLKHILILAIGFFWCSGVYLTEESYLLKYTNGDFVNIVALLYGSLSMALGIFLFSLIYKRTKNIKLYYVLFMVLSIISLIMFFGTDNVVVMSICLCLTCLFGTAGFGAGYHFSLIASNVEKDYRGRVFAFGYGIGSIFTYLITLLPKNIYESYTSLWIYIPIILINIYLVYRHKDLDIIKKESYTKSFKKYFITLSAIVLSMSLLSAISTDVVATYTFDMKGIFASTRIYYCLGLLVAGVLADKHKEIFDICTLVSFVFSLLALFLLNQNISPSLIVALSYFFVGFFVLFRTLTFMNLSDKKGSIIFASAYGLMYSRIMEGIFVLFEKGLVNNYLVLFLLEGIMLGVVMIIFFLLYMRNNNIAEGDKVKEIALKYNLSGQEEKVLNLLMQDLTKKEIADKLFLSVNTIKIHVTNIYKKTGMKKQELKEKCYLRAR